MRGFVVGTLALAVLYVVVQDGAAAKLESGTGVLAAGFRRLLSPDVAGLPDRAGSSSSTSGDSSTDTTTSGPPSVRTRV